MELDFFSGGGGGGVYYRGMMNPISILAAFIKSRYTVGNNRASVFYGGVAPIFGDIAMQSSILRVPIPLWCAL